MSRSTAIYALILVFIAALTSWWRNNANILGKDEVESDYRRVDFFLEKFQIHQYDKNGNIHYHLKGDILEHYPEDDSSEIISPVIFVSQQNGSPWLIEANQANSYSETLEEIQLTGNVKLHRKQPVLLNLTTDKLTVRPDTEYAETDDTVTITDPHSRIVAQKLQADLKNGLFELTDVEAHYDP